MEIKKKREFKPVFNEEMLGTNPFTDKLVVYVSRIEYKGQFKKDKDGYVLPVIGEIEYESLCKIYVNSEKRKKTNALSTRAKELLLWLLYEVKSNEDFIWINRVRYMNENNISSVNTYRAAVKDLIIHGFITRSVVNAIYWINPSLFFSGNRIAKYPKNIKYK